MANLSFTSQGATPGMGTPFNTKTQPISYGTSPVAKALNTAQSTPTPMPSTPVKKTTINNPDGSSHVTEYHAPIEPATSKTPKTSPSVPAPVPTFPGLIGSLANTSQQGSPTAQGYTAKTAEYGAGNLPIGQKAADIAAEYGQKIAEVGGKGAQFQGGLLTTGTSPVAQGNAAIAAQTTAAQQNALATGEEAALQGTAQELTGQSQAANATNEAAGQATAAQGQVQSGLTSAGTLAQPNPTAQGQTTYNPLTNSFSGGSYPQNLATIVNSIKNGSIGYSDGVNSLAGLSPTAKADVLAALGPGFDTVGSDAQAKTRGTNIQTGGTAVTGANAQGLTDSIQQETQLNTAANNAQSLATQVSDALKNSGLNMTNSTDANTAINNLQSRLGNSAYTQLNIAVNDARNAYQAILTATGATPTDAGAAANQNINANMSPKQILAAIDQLSQGVNARQQSQHQQTTQYQNQLNGSGGTSPSGGTSGTTVHTSAGPVNTNW